MFNFLKKQHFSKDPKYRNLLVLMAENFSNQATSTVLGHEKIKIKGEATGCLPNENFVIGYIYGFVDWTLQNSNYSEEHHHTHATARMFQALYGNELGLKITAKTGSLLDKNKKFKKGCTLGAEEAQTLFSGGGISGLALYIQKNIEKGKKLKK